MIVVILKLDGTEPIDPLIFKEGASILKDSPALLQNYRPILLISIVGKVMEQCVFKHINNYLLNHNIITHCQSGFTKETKM
jgi:hypothetical protein